MPASVYKLVFNDSKMQKLAPSNLQVGTYTTDTVKIVGSCEFYFVHQDTTKLMEVTFYVAMNGGSVLLSCKTTLLLGLIQPRSRLDYLPPRASLLTSSADHPTKIKAVLNVQKLEVATQTPAARKEVPKFITSKEMTMHEYPDVFEGLALSRTILLHPDWSQCASKANTLQTNPCTLKRSIPTRNKQDVTGWSMSTSKWSNTLDQ